MYTLLYRQQHAMIRRQAKALLDGLHGEKGASELRVALSRLAASFKGDITPVRFCPSTRLAGIRS